MSDIINIDVPRGLVHSWNKHLLEEFFKAKGPGVILRAPSNSNRYQYRIIAKWVGDVVVSKDDPAYADVIEPLEEACKARGVYICKVAKKFLTKSDAQLAEMLGEMGLW